MTKFSYREPRPLCGEVQYTQLYIGWLALVRYSGTFILYHFLKGQGGKSHKIHAWWIENMNFSAHEQKIYVNFFAHEEKITNFLHLKRKYQLSVQEHKIASFLRMYRKCQLSAHEQKISLLFCVSRENGNFSAHEQKIINFSAQEENISTIFARKENINFSAHEEKISSFCRQ